MTRTLRLLGAAVVALSLACSDSSGPPADPISGVWTGRFSNGITMTATLVLAGSTITGTFSGGGSVGNITGTYTSTTFTFQLAATAGTQRTLSSPLLINGNTRITANWNDGAGQSGTVCFAAAGSTPCP